MALMSSLNDIMFESVVNNAFFRRLQGDLITQKTITERLHSEIMKHESMLKKMQDTISKNCQCPKLTSSPSSKIYG